MLIKVHRRGAQRRSSTMHFRIIKGEYKMAKDWDTTSIDGMERTAKNEADRDCSVKIGAVWLEVSWDGKKFKYKWGKNFVGRDNAIEVFKMKPVMDGYKKR